MEVTVKACKCNVCGHVWLPRNREEVPIRCAALGCKTPYWNRPQKKTRKHS